MPGPTVKEILLKWGIDNSNWKKAIQELSSLLEKTNKQADAAADKAVKKLEAQKAKLKDLIADQKSETTEIQNQIAKLKAKAAAASVVKAEAAATLATQKALTSEANKQLAQEKVIQAQHKSAQAQVNAQLSVQKLITAQINAQTAALRQQAVAARAAQAHKTGGGGGHGGGGGILGTIAGGIFGGGPFGMIAGAVASAEGFEHALELALEKLKEFSQEVGPLQQVREQFEKLAPARGISNPAEFIEKLRGATHGLVNDMALYRNANTFMQSSIHASEEDIVKLTQATVGLSRAQGKDATQAIQALNRFFLTGRSQTLAYVTGIQRAQLTIGQTGRSMDEASRSALQFKQALEVISKQYAAIGEPAETYTEKLQKLGTVGYRVMEEFTLGLQNSAGFKVFLDALDSLVEKLGKVAEKASGFGSQFGNAFVVLTNVFDTVVSTITSVAELFGNLIETGSELALTLMQLSPIFLLMGNSADSFVNKAHPVVTFFTYLDIGIQTAISGLKLFADFFVTVVRMITGGLSETLDLIKDPSWANWKKFFSSKKELEEWKKFTDQVKRDNQELTDSVGTKMDRLMGLDKREGSFKIKFAAPTELFSTQQQEAAAKKLAKIQEDIAIQNAKIQLEQAELRIKKEMELNQVLYDQGLISYRAYMDKKADLDKEEYQAKLKQLQDEFAARSAYNAIESRQQRELAEEKKRDAAQDRQLRLADIENQRTSLELQLEKSGKSPEEKKGILDKLHTQAQALTQMVLASEKASNAVANAELAEVNAKQTLEVKKHLAELGKLAEDYQAKGRQRTEQEVADEVKARQKLYDELKKLASDQIALQKEVTEKEFQEGNINSDEYLQKRVDFIQQEYRAEVDAAAERLAANKDSYSAQAEFAAKTAEAAAKREKDLTQLTIQEWGIRTKAAEAAYDRVKSLLENQLKYTSSLDETNPFATRTEQSSIISGLIVLEEKRLEQQQKELSQTKELSADWFEVRGKIAQTQEQIVKYNQELIKTRDYTNSIVGIAKKLSDVSALFPKGGKTAEGFSKFAQVFEQLGKLNQDFQKGLAAQRDKKAGKSVKPVTPEEVFAALQRVSNETGQSLKTLSSAMQGATQTVQDMKGSMTAGVDYLASKAKATADELERQVKSTSVPALDSLAQHATKAAQALAGIGGKSSGKSDDYFKKGAESRPNIPAGPPTASSPSGTITDSDIQDLDATVKGTTTSSGEDAGISVFSSSLQEASTVVKVFSGVFGNLKDEFQNTLGSNGLFGGIKDIFKGKQDEAGDKLNNAVNGIAKIAGGIGGMISAAKGEGGPFQAAMGGMASGMQLGSMFGPIGAGIGAGVGLLTGLFAGKARKQAEKLAKDIVAQFNAALQNLNSGTQTLSATIQLEIQNIQEAVSRLSGKKGGRDQLKNILPGMETQLAQLQQQQKQIIQTFDEQLNTLNAPQAYQDQLNSVNQIIDKYQQYIQAGGNVANANEYLRQSFVNLVQNGMNELNQSEQDAINNALQYNDLLVQRQQLITDTNQQMQQIMSQGVAIRQMPEGVSRAIQMQKLAYDASKQLDQMNEEISVAKYKLDNESKIFSMATTRIGLENQLVILQNEQTDQDMKRIVALGNVVGAFQEALPTSAQAALQELGLGPAYVSPKTEPGLIPSPPVKTGIADIDLQNQLEYQQALAAYQLQSNYPIGYISPTGPIPTTSPIPGTIGLPSNTLTGGATYMTPGGVYGTASGIAQGALGLAQSAAAAVQQMNKNWNSSLSTVAAPLQTLNSTLMAPSQPSPPNLTVNGQQVNTISTPAGTALLVSMGTEQGVSVPTGPGTTQVVGLVGTATQVVQATNDLFNSLSGAANTAKTALLLKPTPPTATAAPPASIGTVTALPSKSTAPTISSPIRPVAAVATTKPTVVPVAATAPVVPKQATTTVAPFVPKTIAPIIAAPVVPKAPTNPFVIPKTIAPAIAAATSTMSALTPILSPRLPRPVLATATLFPKPVSTTTTQMPAPAPPMAPASHMLRVDESLSQHMTALNSHVQTAVQRHTLESSITQMSHLRTAKEAQLVRMKMQEIHADMARVNAHHDLIDRIGSGKGSRPTTLEDLLQNVYETRGRQGFGGFYGETSNPT